MNTLKNAPRIYLAPTARILAITFLMIASNLLASAQTGTSSKPIRIRFMTGAISAQAKGQLSKGRTEVFYVVKAKTGDHMIVNIISTTPGFATGGEVVAPSGEGEGQHGGIIFNSDLKETGDFKIRVARNLMAGERAGGSFILEIVITPSYIKDGQHH
jgi:hypothetical protein